MKRIILSAIALYAAVSLSAIEPTKRVLLYPEGQNVDKGIVENGVKITEGPLESNGFTGDKELLYDWRYQKVADGAMIDIYLPEMPNGQMMIVCPGGGYGAVCSGHEGRQVAEWALSHRIAVGVLIYRLPNHHCRVPLQDVQNAFRYCRHHASEWGIKQIGVMGFSAGGHLAASASTLWVDETTRPDFSVLFYPVIDFIHNGHLGTRKNLLPEDADESLVAHYSLQTQVNAQTPKTLLMLSQDDSGVKPFNSIGYFEKLLENGVPSELHIFSSGKHGWGFGPRLMPDKNGGYHMTRDLLGEAQRADFNKILERWLADRRAEIK